MTDKSTLEALTAHTLSVLQKAVAEYAPVTFASSLAAEDMVLTDLILRHKLPIQIFTLNTGRLHQQTLDMLDKVEARYGYKITPYLPDAAAVAAYVSAHGLNGFYDSVELRKECCRIRKIVPLGKALQGKASWVTGQRKAQSLTRNSLDTQEYDAAHQMEKFNPLADWEESDVWDYIRQQDVPYNALHDQGFPSIGCEPCTRAIEPGEDIRAGRWWWESPDTKECGLHVVDGKLVRIKKTTA